MMPRSISDSVGEIKILKEKKATALAERSGVAGRRLPANCRRAEGYESAFGRLGQMATAPGRLDHQQRDTTVVEWFELFPV